MSDNGARLPTADAEDTQQLYQTGPDTNECSNSWLHYLQMLNGFCAAGARLSASIQNFSSKSGQEISGNDCPGQIEWDTITQQLMAATLSAQSKSIPVIQSLEYYGDIHPELHQTNKKIIDNILSMLNVQYRFCLASCDRLIAITGNTQFSNDLSEHEINGRVQSSPHKFNSNRSECSVLPKLTSRGYPLDEIQTRPPNFVYDVIDEKKYEAIFAMQYPEVYRKYFINSNFHSQRNYQQPVDNRAMCLSNPPNAELYHGPPIEFLDTVRNVKYSDDQNNYSSIMKKTQFGLRLPPLSSETAQLRRWSEAAAHEMGERQDDSCNTRRWSVPWDGGQPPITETSGNWNDTPNSNPWDHKLTDDRDPLETAILLLSLKPQTGNTENPNPMIPEQAPRRPPCTSDSARGYSIWSGSGAIPFLRLPESQE